MAHATLPELPAPGVIAKPRWTSSRFVWAVAVVAAVARLPFVNAPAGADEAGFLQVAHQWAPGGGSLYGHYWVDRPPLLITLYRFADLAGGVVPLRLLGCVAVAAAVLMSARAAGLLAGGRAARWAALASAAMLVSPLLGTQEVNGELLSAPFVAAGILAFVAASQPHDRRRALLLVGLGGAAAACALLVKQNIADALVFGSVFLVAGAPWPTASNVRSRITASIAGGSAALVLVAVWTVAHGTSLTGVFDAMYPFRLRAAQVVAAGGSQYAGGRGLHLALAFVTSGAGLLAAALVVATTRRRAWNAAVVALASTVAFDVFSIAFGGGYWLHYLAEMAVPLAVWAGVLVARGAAVPRISVLLVTAVSMVSLLVTGLQPSTSTGQQVGTAIARAAEPGDTLTTLYGEADVNLASGLPSPYQYLWSLPIKTLDPELASLDSVLRSPQAPTWLVVTRDVSSWGLDTARTQAVITIDYHVVAQIDGHTIYLHDGTPRPSPTPIPTSATTTSSTNQEKP